MIQQNALEGGVELAANKGSSLRCREGFHFSDLLAGAELVVALEGDPRLIESPIPNGPFLLLDEEVTAARVLRSIPGFVNRLPDTGELFLKEFR